jgi:hypothetical protein
LSVRLTVISVGLVVVAFGCGIPDDSRVSRIPGGELGALDDTIPATTTSTSTTTVQPTTTTTPLLPETTIATQEVTLYFISGGILKDYQPLPLPVSASASQVLGVLQDGPKEGSFLRTALPKLDVPLEATEDGTGVATVDLPQGFFDLIPPDDQRFAVGQIVLTIIENVSGVGQVRFTQGGAPYPVPKGASGDLSEAGQALTKRDYQSLLESPPVETTTTTTTVG